MNTSFAFLLMIFGIGVIGFLVYVGVELWREHLKEERFADRILQ